MLGGCVTAPPIGLPAEPVELTQTPFFPQRGYQCGPSALATLLGSAGVAADVDTLTSQVYVPGRRGSLQPELVAATRRHGLLPVELSTDVPGLLTLVTQGVPVLVLQRLGRGPIRTWHYATVIGYLPERDRLVLRSGTKRRELMRSTDFLRTWRRAGQWALIAVGPGSLPQGVGEADYVRAAVRFESSGNLAAALRVYRAGLSRWPAQPTLLLGQANTLYGLDNKIQAVTAYREVIALQGENAAAAANNLANVLLELDCPLAAQRVLDDLPAVKPGPLAAAIADTREQVVVATDQAAVAEAQCKAPPGFSW